MITVHFKPELLNKIKYQEILEKLQQDGGNTAGRIFHVSYGNNPLQIFDVWDSKENFENFGQTLMPILQQMNFNPGEPEINEVYNILESSTEEIAKKIYNYFNERKFNEAVEYISEKSVIHNKAQNIQLYGKEGFLGFMNFWVTAFPDAKVEITNMISTAEYVTTEFTGRGTHNGILDTPMGKINPTGKKIEISFCEIFYIKNGKILTSHLYFDLATMMHQLELTAEKA